jgi:integrase/recombinase XerD
MKNHHEMFFSELAEKNFSLNTIQSYRHDLSDFFVFLKECNINSIDEIKKSHVRSYSERMKSCGLSDASIYRKSTTIIGFFRFLKNKFPEINDPTKEIERPKIHRENPDYISEENLRRLIDHIDLKTFIGQRDRMILEVLYGTGIKVSELINLEIIDIDLEGSNLFVKGRYIPLGNTLIALINNYLEHIRPSFDKDVSSRLFLNYKGYQISRQGIWKNIKKYSSIAGLKPSITPHMLRSSYAINRINSGIQLTVIQKEMGYRKLDSTRFFTHSTYEEV